MPCSTGESAEYPEDFPIEAIGVGTLAATRKAAVEKGKVLVVEDHPLFRDAGATDRVAGDREIGGRRAAEVDAEAHAAEGRRLDRVAGDRGGVHFGRSGAKP